MLIDAGDNSEGTAVQSYLDSQNVEKIDYAIGTHPDADHIGGLDVVVYKFDCKKVFMPDVTSDTKTYDDVVQALKSKNQESAGSEAWQDIFFRRCNIYDNCTGKGLWR